MGRWTRASCRPGTLAGSSGIHNPIVWWIDDDGTWRLVDNNSPFEYVSAPFGNDPIAEVHAFRWLGLVKIRESAYGITVRWHVQSVAPRAIEEVADFLTRHADCRAVRLTFFFRGWASEIHSSADQAVARLRQVMAYRDVEIFDGVSVQPVGLEGLVRSGSLVRRGFAAWERSRGLLTRYDENPLSGFLPKLLVFRPRERDGRLVFAHAGPRSASAAVWGPEWAANARGQESVPDKDYDSRVADSATKVLEGDEPRLDHLRALCVRDNGEAIWCPYQRLTLPIHFKDGSKGVGVLSLLTQNVDIPFMANAA